MARDVNNLLFVLGFAVVFLVFLSPAAVMAKRSHDSGSSDGGGNGSHDSGSNDNSNSGGDSNNGNDNSGDNSNSGNDKGSEQQEAKPEKPINDPLNPGKDDTRDISDIPSENCKNAACAKPIETVGPSQPVICEKGMVCGGPAPGPEPTPTPKPPVIKIIDIINIIIHKHGSSHHTTVVKNVGMSADCYSVIKMMWTSNIHHGQNAQIDNYVNNCLGVVVAR